MKQHSKEFYDKQYDKYLKAYEDIKNKQLKYGLPMADKKYTRSQFEIWFDNASVDVDFKRQKQSISKQLAQRQAWEVNYSRTQKNRIRKFAKEYYKQDKSIVNGEFGYVEELYNDMLNSGLTASEASDLITNNVFGSP